ncbi:class I SAM-dependent methyltransferase [Streptococcus cameli]
MIITTSSRVTSVLEREAKEMAAQYNLEYVERRKRSLAALQDIYGDLLLLTQEGLSLEYQSGERFVFHPDTAMLRIKAPRDPLLELLGQEPLTILDTTMGLASDSIVMSYAGHSVHALESQELIHLIVARGLQTFSTGNTEIDQAMRRIQTTCVDSLAYLQKLPKQSVDVVYCDPMFSEEISESQNLSGMKQIANSTPLNSEFLSEAKRVARKKIILKAHFRDDAFERFGFTRHVRPYQKFHFGDIRLEK